METAHLYLARENEDQLSATPRPLQYSKVPSEIDMDLGLGRTYMLDQKMNTRAFNTQKDHTDVFAKLPNLRHLGFDVSTVADATWDADYFDLSCKASTSDISSICESSMDKKTTVLGLGGRHLCETEDLPQRDPVAYFSASCASTFDGCIHLGAGGLYTSTLDAFVLAGKDLTSFASHGMTGAKHTYIDFRTSHQDFVLLQSYRALVERATSLTLAWDWHNVESPHAPWYVLGGELRTLRIKDTYANWHGADHFLETANLPSLDTFVFQFRDVLAQQTRGKLIGFLGRSASLRRLVIATHLSEGLDAPDVLSDFWLCLANDLKLQQLAIHVDLGNARPEYLHQLKPGNFWFDIMADETDVPRGKEWPMYDCRDVRTVQADRSNMHEVLTELMSRRDLSGCPRVYWPDLG